MIVNTVHSGNNNNNNKKKKKKKKKKKTASTKPKVRLKKIKLLSQLHEIF